MVERGSEDGYLIGYSALFVQTVMQAYFVSKYYAMSLKLESVVL